MVPGMELIHNAGSQALTKGRESGPELLSRRWERGKQVKIPVHGAQRLPGREPRCVSQLQQLPLPLACLGHRSFWTFGLNSSYPHCFLTTCQPPCLLFAPWKHQGHFWLQAFAPVFPLSSDLHMSDLFLSFGPQLKVPSLEKWFLTAYSKAVPLAYKPMVRLLYSACFFSHST